MKRLERAPQKTIQMDLKAPNRPIISMRFGKKRGKTNLFACHVQVKTHPSLLGRNLNTEVPAG